MKSMNTILILTLAVVVVLFLVVKQLGQVKKGAAQEYLKNGALLIDVRSPGEYQSGHITNAINIPVGELEARIAKIAPNKDQVLLLHCASGVRSGMGTKTLKQMGYTKVYNLGSYGRAESIVRTNKP
jgi:phage shock protein E